MNTDWKFRRRWSDVRSRIFSDEQNIRIAGADRRDGSAQREAPVALMQDYQRKVISYTKGAEEFFLQSEWVQAMQQCRGSAHSDRL